MLLVSYKFIEEYDKKRSEVCSDIIESIDALNSETEQMLREGK